MAGRVWISLLPTSPAPGIAIKQKTLVIAGVVLVAVIAVVVIATGLLVSDKNSKPMPEAGRADQEHRKQPAGAEPQPTVESLKECVLTVTKQMNDRLASEAEQKWSLIVKVSGKKKGYILEDANCLLKEGSQIAVGMGLSQALWELQDKIDSAKNEGEPRPVLAPDAEVWAYSKYSKFAAPVVVDIKTDSSSTIYSHEGIVRFSSRKVSCRGKATLTGFFSENELDKDWGNPFADGPGQENAKRKAVTDAAMEMFKTSPIIEEGDSLPYTTVIYRWHREKRCWVGQKIEKD